MDVTRHMYLLLMRQAVRRLSRDKGSHRALCIRVSTTEKQELNLQKQQEMGSASTMQDKATQLVAHKRDAAEQASILRC